MKKSLLLSAVLAASAGFAIHAYRPLETMDVFRAHASAIKILDAHTREFGHPMVPGGIHSIEDAEKHRALYPNLGPHLRMSKLRHGIFAYVSYRMNGKTYWTKNKRYIPSNEPVITDDVAAIILQRCGNELRYTQPAPIDTLDYEPGDLYPPSSPVDPSGTEFRIGPPINDEAVSTPETIYSQPPTPVAANVPVFVPYGFSVSMPQTPISTPEPSTLVGLSFGLLFVMFMRFFIWRP